MSFVNLREMVDEFRYSRFARKIIRLLIDMLAIARQGVTASYRLVTIFTG